MPRSKALAAARRYLGIQSRLSIRRRGGQRAHGFVEIEVQALVARWVVFERLDQHADLIEGGMEGPGAIFLPFIVAARFLEPLERIEFEVGQERRGHVLLHAVEPFVLLDEQKFPVAIAHP